MYQYGQVDIRALQELLGHESISTTEIYTHVATEQVREIFAEANPLVQFVNSSVCKSPGTSTPTTFDINFLFIKSET